MMNKDNASAHARAGVPLPAATFIGFALAFAAVLVIAVYSLTSQRERVALVKRLTDASLIIERSEEVLSTLQDAETGQRGFLLTGEESYSTPFELARTEIAGRLQGLAEVSGGDAQMSRDVLALQRLASDKFSELEETIRLRRAGDTSAALAVVRTGRGKIYMDQSRVLVAAIRDEALTGAEQQRRQWQADTRTAQALNLAGSGLLLVLIAMAAIIARRDFRSQAQETWIRAGQSGLAERLQGERRLQLLGERALAFITDWLEAPVGAVHLVTEAGALQEVAAHALPENRASSAVAAGQGLVGQAVKDGRLLHLRQVPSEYWPVTSSIGAARPRELVIAPAMTDGVVHGVIELGFFRPVTSADLALLRRSSEMVAIALRAARDRTRLEELLEKSQQQAQELQAQQEELRVSNEELEERGRALTASQAQLETQQAELEQSNTQLGEQTRLLERQNDDLIVTQQDLTAKATELEQASRYKSEFLANMSHELRTPLNSTLILAKLLADNGGGNLTAEQVQYAQTIQSAGQDLLGLINDILELSKIEAGRLTIVREQINVTSLVNAVLVPLQPIAVQKGLTLEAAIDPTAPSQMQSDPHRLSQILRNLVANALKFTDRGQVGVRVRDADSGSIAFDVRDTGIGIPESQHQVIFDAFRQADGSIHRKYGGTGLGLSISRDLARLLGGDIVMASKPGEGSIFTLTLPLQAPTLTAAAPVEPPSRIAPPSAALLPVETSKVLADAPVADDRFRLTHGRRLILVIEDDPHFAAVLRDVAHELDFDCVICGTAEDGLLAATRFKPSGILLDINLPDHSGLSVLDRLKRDPLLRHIPVHGLSVEDHAREAMHRGAVGYALKPLQREELVVALRRLEATFTPRVRRVLVVEDDERQRTSLAVLLGHGDIEVIGAANGAEALQQLRQTPFDCIVMDLNLPDLSGDELLERMAQEHAATPPVIVYTGRSLSAQEEQRLRRHSHSIIVKGARSPERLLDEVTLFLHQVEADLPPESRRMLRAARDRDAAFEGRRILIAEDDARNIFALSRILEPRGAKVEIARNGREALEALAQRGTQGSSGIDLVLMDLMMPEMDGLTAIREIRRHAEWQKLPIIALTAKAMQDDRDNSLAAGANDYCAKPLDVDKLVALIRIWMPN